MYATDYVKGRQAFGRTIADFQGIQWEIAKCAVDIEAARLLTYRAAAMADAGQVHQGGRTLPVDGQVPRHRAGRAGLGAGRAAARGGRLHGGPPHRAVVPRRQQLTIVEGTSQVQLNLIARGVLDGDLWWD